MGKLEEDLIAKYDKPVPRYTSYPTVPDWQLEAFSKEEYLTKLSDSFVANNDEGLSLYIHLPYCESLCTYCGCNTHISVNHQVEYPYIKALLKEWKMYLKTFGQKPKLKEIHLGGGTPTFFAADNLKFLIEEIVASVELLPGYEFSFEGHPNNTTYEHLKVLKEVGFSRVSFGIQDFDHKVQQAINRIQPLDQVTEVTEWARSLGYESVNFDLIYGLPFQNEASIINTIQKVKMLNPDRIAFYSYAHVPWKRPGQRAYSEADLPSPSMKRKLNVLGQDLLRQSGYLPIGMDHFALPKDSLVKAFEEGRLHRNFMGYTTSNSELLIGLGVSSISDTGLGYAQNAKSVKGYLMHLDKGELPIVKGHIMTAEDRKIKRKLLAVACEQKITTKDALKLYLEQREQLEDLIADGLLEKTSEGFEVTSTGTQFLRNICALFDPNFGKQNGKKVFSQAI
ncbi:oxygen-independent coproporphyrinogen III oxidase [Roseivirga sp. E12]|uniref:oxygen-independent coproporphyrinogen III oxidase n=1 Tax=Roseivirga sp. E12 TaxID=2819237 RepID=UPI001ABC09AD|nr:oxygen-independent coproporphyrinogen III oxidase [Roseivirga sp. E12]MBO3698203.1 oxygen-independent coproporphyrinogen III oxidase [Roseivirga sp. E12]